MIDAEKGVVFELLSRKTAEETVSEYDCSGSKWDDIFEGLREDIIRFVLEGAEIQRDKDEETLLKLRLNEIEKFQEKFGDLFKIIQSD